VCAWQEFHDLTHVAKLIRERTDEQLGTKNLKNPKMEH
jgi:hypothetical protein